MEFENNTLLNNPDSQRLIERDKDLKRIVEDLSEEGVDLSEAKPGLVLLDDPTLKQYLLLLVDNEGDQIWYKMENRQEVFNYLKDLIISEAIDPDASFILESSMKVQNAVTVHFFLKKMANDELVLDSGRTVDELLPYDPHQFTFMEVRE